MNNQNLYNPKNDPDPYIRFVAQDLPGGKWAAVIICMLLFGWMPFVAVLYF